MSALILPIIYFETKCSFHSKTRNPKNEVYGYGTWAC